MTVQLHLNRRNGQLYLVRGHERDGDQVFCVCEWVDVRGGVLLHTGHVQKLQPRVLEPRVYDIVIEIDAR